MVTEGLVVSSGQGEEAYPKTGRESTNNAIRMAGEKRRQLISNSSQQRCSIQSGFIVLGLASKALLHCSWCIEPKFETIFPINDPNMAKNRVPFPYCCRICRL